MTTSTTSSPVRDEARVDRPRLGYVLSALSLLVMAAITITAWPDMAEHLTQEQSRRHMLIEPRKALGNAIAPVVLLIVVAVITLMPDWTRPTRRRSLIAGAEPAQRRRMLNLTLGLTSLLMLGVHIGVVWAYLGHAVDPARLSAWCMAGVSGFVGLMTLLGSFPLLRPGAGIRVTGAVMAAAGIVAGALSFTTPLVGVVVATVALTVGVVVVVLLGARRLVDA